MSNPKDDLIGALVLKAKEGNSGESENAKRALKRLCEKHGLDYDDIMSGSIAVKEHMIEYRRGQEDLLAQVIIRYGTSAKHPDVLVNRRARKLFFTGTDQQYIEVLNAYEILSRLYSKERKKMQDIFLHSFVKKHRLYRTYERSRELIGEEKEKTVEEQIEDMRKGMLIEQMAGTMEDAEINPRLQGGSV